MRTTKKLLCLFLSIVMVITSSSIGFTAFAADGNKTDKNLNYWNDATEAEEAFDALNDLLGSLIQIDAIKNLLQDNDIVNPVTSSTTLSDVVAGASPMLLKALAGGGSKEEFLRAKYGDKYDANPDMYNEAFAPLDNPDAKEDDWSFYALYNFCQSGVEAENAALKKYCKDTLKDLEDLIKACEKNLDTRDAGDTAIKNLYPSYDDTDVTKTTLGEIGKITNSYVDKTLADIVTDDDMRAALGGDYYYFDYYLNVFDKLGVANNDNGLPTALPDAATLFMYHCGSMGKIILYTYVYIYLMDKAGTPLTANKLVSGNDTVITVNNLDTIKSIYPETGDNGFRTEYIGSGKPFPYTGRSNAVKTDIYNTFWMYAIFDKYILNGSTLDSFNTDFESVSPDYFNLLKGLNADAKLATGEFADADSLAEAMLEGMGDKAEDYKAGDKKVKIADYFISEFCNKFEKTDVEHYDYANYDNLPESASVAAANTALNATVLPILEMTSPIDIQKLIGKVLDGDMDLVSTVTDIWQRLYDEPAVTVFNLLH